jgi:glycosyltransferase involved in cell wall biosynthesis
MNILVYYDSSNFAIYVSSVAVELSKTHSVILLTQSSKGEIHSDVEKYGVKSYGYELQEKNSIWFYFKQLVYLIRFIKSNRIELVISHNHPCNFASVFAQFFCKAKFIISRHHTDIVMLGNNKMAKRIDRIINRFGKKFIVPSTKTVNQMILSEGVAKEKIVKIPYAYNFDDYPKINSQLKIELKNQYPGALIFITIGRLIEGKRTEELIIEFEKWCAAGMNIRLLILGDGPNKSHLDKLIQVKSLSSKVILLGRQPNVLDYIYATDLVIHLSESETSCSVIKEAAICEKPVIVCEDVGDFDEYMKHHVNGFVIPKYGYEEQLFRIVTDFYSGKEKFSQLGVQLNKDVMQKFSIDKIIHQYENILDSI